MGKWVQLNKKAQSSGQRVGLGLLWDQQIRGEGQVAGDQAQRKPEPDVGAQGRPMLPGPQDEEPAKETGETLAMSLE